MTRKLVVAAALLLGGAALADGLPNLPQGLALPRGTDSPGQVTFNHESHVDAAKPGCVSCHPRRFAILGRSATERRTPAITHAAMEKGEACGACHGKQAFGFDDCTGCHAG
ncbi:c(7)-type cytochrome triheme domain-containing protein [Anaeromyxobacter oryzisoli]|uniref:c(7)-type cytochrome triheme domain-containing protein n=1 Tax=Anaeromyxobacter oryzisoli TaxID=2925408 RepID=UPI001F57A0C6|nr:c(7)-type cytochrome triheme domain-containing protein [Anaeromyxobacter sp. SG63]